MAGIVQFTTPNGKVVTAAADCWIAAMLAEMDPETAERITKRAEDVQNQINEARERNSSIIIPPPIDLRKAMNGGATRPPGR